MSNVVILGGFAESQRALEPVAEAVAGGNRGDIEVLTLREAKAMDDERLRQKVAGAQILTHSAGVTAVPDAKTIGSERELPEELIIVAGVEPQSPSVLSSAAKTKTGHHLFGPTPHRRRDHWRVVAGNTAEMIAHPFVNNRLIEGISQFSTLHALDRGRLGASQWLGSFMMTHDIFYQPYPGWRDTVLVQDLAAAGTVIEEIPGGHDELLVNPSGVLDSMKQAIEQANGEAPELT